MNKQMNRAQVGDMNKQVVEYRTRYGGLSRGRCWARREGSEPVEWAPKSGGTVYLTDGTWIVGSSDGYRRSQKSRVVVKNGEVVES